MALSEEQLELLSDRLVPLFQEFESAVIGDIVRRLKKTGRLTETAELMARGLQRKGFSPAVIRSQVMRFIKADKAFIEAVNESTLEAKRQLEEEIKQMREKAGPFAQSVVEEAGNFAFNNDLSAWKGERMPVKGSAFERLVSAMKERANDEILNLTKTMGFRFASGQMVSAQKAYTHALNLALAKTVTGAYSYQQALEEALRELARSGLRVVDYESGYSRQIDSAARSAILTASTQLSGQITMMNVEDTGVELVEVSKHWGARTGHGHGNHAAWQGGIYCVNGTDGVHQNLEEATGYPSDPKGLHGYNCRHTFYPFWEGVSTPAQWPEEPKPVTINGRTYSYYQLTQEQRRMEREIRAMKREAFAFFQVGDPQKAKQAKSRAAGMTAEYNEFSEMAGISPKPNRLRVVTVAITQ